MAGALATEVVRLHKQVTKTPPGTVRFTLDFVVVSLLLIMVGGILAVAYNDNRVLWCLGIGAGTPAIISALVAAINSRG
jgi:hypothetical protein